MIKTNWSRIKLEETPTKNGCSNANLTSYLIFSFLFIKKRQFEIKFRILFKFKNEHVQYKIYDTTQMLTGNMNPDISFITGAARKRNETHLLV